ncbi:hypothetical protein BXY58_0948 [Epilithonimonas arachidiradicis]|uniref:Uncharacterized protein n=1 Tax=Epilithonimonas arachidiradicis TaxID=1617282 RepID=A0A420DBH1_9FLAO|nr:hypothetical protein BXY58_0948 [Epilithonimonas arachidiradicis]
MVYSNIYIKMEIEKYVQVYAVIILIFCISILFGLIDFSIAFLQKVHLCEAFLLQYLNVFIPEKNNIFIKKNKCIQENDIPL